MYENNASWPLLARKVHLKNTEYFFIISLLFQMPRVNNTKSNKARWNAEQPSAAKNQIKRGRSIPEVARSFAISRSTLQLRLKRNCTAADSLGSYSMFIKDEEEVLSEQVITLARHFYGISPIEIKKCAFKYSEEKNNRHPFFNFVKVNVG